MRRTAFLAALLLLACSSDTTAPNAQRFAGVWQGILHGKNSWPFRSNQAEEWHSRHVRIEVRSGANGVEPVETITDSVRVFEYDADRREYSSNFRWDVRLGIRTSGGRIAGDTIVINAPPPPTNLTGKVYTELAHSYVLDPNGDELRMLELPIVMRRIR